MMHLGGGIMHSSQGLHGYFQDLGMRLQVLSSRGRHFDSQGASAPVPPPPWIRACVSLISIGEPLIEFPEEVIRDLSGDQQYLRW